MLQANAISYRAVNFAISSPSRSEASIMFFFLAFGFPKDDGSEA